MDLFSILSLLCGLSLFLYGMNTMGGGLERLAGGKLEKTLEKLTDSTLKSFFLGAAVTAVIQSSSATTVMVVGFVNSGIMKLRQAIGIIMGANVGTTFTSWILSLSGIEGDSVFIRLLKPSSFSAVFAFVGIILLMFFRSEKKRNLGSIFIGFAVLMVGLDAMSNSVKPLADNPAFVGILTAFENPFFGIAAGAVLTAIIQSSSAAIGILQALSATGSITFSMAIPIVMGQNIGTCVTALLSCVGAKKNAKRAAAVHLYFNLFGMLAGLIAFYGFGLFISYEFLNKAINPADVAIIHTIFNIFATALLLPFNKQLEKLAVLTVKDRGEDGDIPFLDERFLGTPSVAAQRAASAAKKMAELSEKNLLASLRLLYNYDLRLAQEIEDNEKTVDIYEDVISTYLVKLGKKRLSSEDSRQVQLVLHSIGDFERISDHAVNISEAAREMNEKNIKFSEKADKGLAVILKALKEILNISVESFSLNAPDIAKKVEPLEQVIDKLRDKLKEEHVKRLTSGECDIVTGFIFSDLLTSVERVSDHCSNIAVAVIEIDRGGFETHEYLYELKHSDDMLYNQYYREYRQKYSLYAKTEC